MNSDTAKIVLAKLNQAEASLRLALKALEEISNDDSCPCYVTFSLNHSDDCLYQEAIAAIKEVLSE